jgi:hypothetical protein
MSDHTLSGMRLYSLLGDAMHDLPPHFIDKLERILRANGVPHPVFQDTPRLRLVPPLADPPPAAAKAHTNPQPETGSSPVYSRQQCVIVILDILHAVHVSHTSGNDVVVMNEELVEGLIIAARELIREA